ncbi:MAG: Transcriptional activator protein LasR [Alphaproteobacteria bacterium]|nr:Transcriptional activator protein LasR [Alphaproteobacteria bacterium]MDB5740052.1 Transcriptional activator protein LasR [Alphaproteobacteria bacterium]
MSRAVSALLAPAVLDVVIRIAAQKTIANVWRAYLEAARIAGFSYGMAFFLPRNRSIGATVFADDFPTGWLKNYIAKGYQPDDPLMARNETALTPFAWDMAEWEDAPQPTRQRWRDDNKAAGVQAGLTIPDRSAGNFKMITVCGANNDLDPLDRSALHFAGLAALNRMQELGIPPRPDASPALTQRERECLTWIAAGKSDWEIGCILSISEKTVNSHVEHAKQKLGATTRAQAVVAALRIGAVIL